MDILNHTPGVKEIERNRQKKNPSTIAYHRETNKVPN